MDHSLAGISTPTRGCAFRLRTVVAGETGITLKGVRIAPIRANFWHAVSALKWGIFIFWVWIELFQLTRKKIFVSMCSMMWYAEIRASHSRLSWIRPVISAVLRYALPQALSDRCLNDLNCRLKFILFFLLFPSNGTPLSITVELWSTESYGIWWLTPQSQYDGMLTLVFKHSFHCLFAQLVWWAWREMTIRIQTVFFFQVTESQTFLD